jgi:hypothetical protein
MIKHKATDVVTTFSITGGSHVGAYADGMCVKKLQIHTKKLRLRSFSFHSNRVTINGKAITDKIRCIFSPNVLLLSLP